MEIQFISSAGLKTSLQTNLALKSTGFTFPWGRSAALSTVEPHRNVVGNWKNKACLEVEALMLAAQADKLTAKASRLFGSLIGTKRAGK